MNMQVGGLGGLIILALDIWAIINIIQSKSSDGNKVLWVLLVILLPVVGLVLWFFLGPRNGRS
jgi:hypothetical protein